MPKACVGSNLLDYKLVSKTHIFLLTSVQRPDRLRHGVHRILQYPSVWFKGGNQYQRARSANRFKNRYQTSQLGTECKRRKEERRKGTECSNHYYYVLDRRRKVLQNSRFKIGIEIFILKISMDKFVQNWPNERAAGFQKESDAMLNLVQPSIPIKFIDVSVHNYQDAQSSRLFHN